MRYQTKGVGKFHFNDTSSSIVGLLGCVSCSWKLYVTTTQKPQDEIEAHVKRAHPELCNDFGVLATPEGDDEVDYFVVTNPAVLQSA